MDFQTLYKVLQTRREELETPCFVFDLRIIEKKIRQFQDALKPEKTFFAVKCNSLHPVLETIRDSHCGLDVNNLQEQERTQCLERSSDDIINTSPITPAQDIFEMFSRGVRRFTADCRCQVDNLALNAPGAEIFIRIASSNTGSSFCENHRLGVEPENANSLIRYALESGLDVCGLSFHPGSQCTPLENWKSGISSCGRLARELPFLKILHIGGGFPVSYHTPAPDIDTVAATIHKAIQDYYPFLPRLWAQPSRFLVANAAITLTSVLHVDETCYPRRLFVDASVFAGHGEILADRNGFQYPISSLEPGKEFFHHRVYGSTSSQADTFARDAILPAMEANHQNPALSSRVVFSKTGAYTTDLTSLGRPSSFNGARIPAVYFIIENQLVRLQ
ncbi:MAG: hypothetical protein JEZ02_18230 [Desulfatibacillum sp.]|nr:hypothetical protein [Desulfatibacillum sp.]